MTIILTVVGDYSHDILFSALVYFLNYFGFFFLTCINLNNTRIFAFEVYRYPLLGKVAERRTHINVMGMGAVRAILSLMKTISLNYM